MTPSYAKSVLRGLVRLTKPDEAPVAITVFAFEDIFWTQSWRYRQYAINVQRF